MLKVFDIAASAMQAQSQRLNAVASNIANAESASSNAETGYRAKQVVFQTTMLDAKTQSAGVKVANVQEDQSPLRPVYNPGHPLANDKGYVFMPNVNPVSEMADMLSSSRAYQMNVDVMNSAKTLSQKALQIGTE